MTLPHKVPDQITQLGANRQGYVDAAEALGYLQTGIHFFVMFTFEVALESLPGTTCECAEWA